MVWPAGMSLETWLGFCAMTIVLCFVPGPAVLFVVSAALARGGRPGMAAALGILVANTFYFALSATGIAAILVASYRLFVVLKWAGTAYLVLMGLRMLLSSAEPPAAVTPQAVRRAVGRGFLVQASNPTAIVFFVALIPQFIDATRSVTVQLLVLGVSALVIELAVLSTYVASAVRVRRFAGDRFARPLTRLAGGVLLAAGARLALVRSAP